MPILQPTPEQQTAFWALVAGVGGGFIRLGVLDESLKPWQKVTTACAGAAVAVYFAPWANTLIPGHNDKSVLAVGFLLGLTGMELCRALVKVTNRRTEPGRDKFARNFINRGTKQKQGEDTTENEEAEPQEEVHP